MNLKEENIVTFDEILRHASIDERWRSRDDQWRSFRKKLFAAAVARGYSPDELASFAGYSDEGSLRRALRRHHLNLENFLMICDHLGCTPEELWPLNRNS